MKVLTSIKEFLLDLFLPVFCFICGKEGDYLCADCLASLDVSRSASAPGSASLDRLYCASDYNNFWVKRLVQRFKYPPYARGLKKPLASLIITHFALLGKLQLPAGEPSGSRPAAQARLAGPFAGFVLVPVPLQKSKTKERGFNQSEEIARELAKVLALPVLAGCLKKIKKTRPQAELSAAERKENVKAAFVCSEPVQAAGRKILLVDDVYTSGATMEECARVLKKAGAACVWGVAAARG